MKKIYAFIAAVFMAISASAQSEEGSITLQPNVGITYSTATGYAGDDVDPAIGLTAGVEGMYMVSDNFGLALGLNYTGYNVSGSYGFKDDVIASNYYFNIPFTANYYVAEGLALKTGIALNILSTAKVDGEDEFKMEILGYKKEIVYKDAYKSTFFSFPIGVSYEINNLVFDARYNFGIGRIYTEESGSFNALTFTVGYKF
jgi:hypothetical protein